MATGETPKDDPLDVLPQSPGTLTNDEKTWGMLCHLSGPIAVLLGGMMILGPLICWLIKKDSSRYVDYHGKEALNFQINLLVYFAVCFALFCLVIGMFLLPVVGLYALVVPIIAGIKANQGEYFKYPFIFRLIN